MAQGRFTKGKSGNPKGRPRGRRESQTQAGSAFDVIVDKTLTMTHGGQAREVSVEEALQHQTYLDAIAGSAPARREVLKMILKRERHLSARRQPKPVQIEQRIEHDPRTADQAMLILGIVCHNPDRQDWKNKDAQLLLEPWAVQAALGRRRGGTQLTDKEREEIKRCTRNSEQLRWARKGRP